MNNKNFSLYQWITPNVFPLFWNLLLVFACYMLCRIEFLVENWELFRDSLAPQAFLNICLGGFWFDACAIFYANSLYILLVLLPLHWKEKVSIGRVLKWLFVVINSICIIVNLADSVYFPFGQRRTTILVFRQFENENNLFSIICMEFISHWYLVLFAIVLIYALIKLYRPASILTPENSLVYYYISGTLQLAIMAVVTVFFMRGGSFAKYWRPISVSNAHQYTTAPIQTNIVLNTPFAIMRTWSNQPPQIPVYFADSSAIDSIYTPVHLPDSNRTCRHKNIVIIMVESYGQEFIGSRNKHLHNGTYKGYTPFTDSLLAKSLTWEETFSNSGFSIDAMPAVLASIPRIDRPFVLTPFSLNRLNSIATELKHWGYYSAFFHGAPNGSMGFESFAHSIGFDKYIGMTEYVKDRRFGGKSDFDGTWGIWDEPFLQFYATKMSEMNQPFITTVFTVSSHHPFKVPDKYSDVFPEEGKLPMNKCVRYTDYALKRFFETASRQPWYQNTLFVLTADHAQKHYAHDEYRNEVGFFRITILFFDPSGEMPHGVRSGIAQQIDIMPTLLNYMGYNRPYIAFGNDLLNTEATDTWAVNWDHIAQYIQGNYTLYFDGIKSTALYDYRHDPLLKTNLLNKRPKLQGVMEKRLKAILQSYMERMKNNDCTINADYDAQ